ncbi:hypothetical protein GCM10027280_15160 [Micromonospora polyrhachis]|uniref:Uncharacterized protein n=1 Tax=Micromonospora polyrhachis TaxID=1282883 RepID=A0A7W7SPU3_9ACTN|nr:hypothetical protein [Micromonospora polyrhachis]MBB4958596.1 hypothetical protein [Micromonospora polyrhachis]
MWRQFRLGWMRHVAHMVVARLRRLSRRLRQWVSNHQRQTTLIGVASLLVAATALLNDVRSASRSPADRVPGAVVAGGPTETPKTDPGAAASTTPKSPVPKTWPAKIVNTYSEEQRRFRGVVAARSPYIPGRADRGYPEGTVIYVICQAHDGRLVADEVSGRQLSSTIWNRTTDDVWVPDIYSDLPKGTGDLPPKC